MRPERPSSADPVAESPGRAFLLRAAQHHRRGDPLSALRDCEQALEREPLAWQAHRGRGLALLLLGRDREALAPFRRAVELAPDNPGNWLSLADALDYCRLLDEAAAAWENVRQTCLREIAAQPTELRFHRMKARAERRLGRNEQALLSFRRILARNPDDAEALEGAFRAGRDRGDWSDWPALPEKLVSLAARGERLPPFFLLGLPMEISSQTALTAARAASDAHTRGAPLSRARPPRRPGRLRVGYLSPDFNDHAVAHALPGVFETHDRARVEVFVYSIGRDDRSPIRRRLETAAEHWSELSELSHDAAATRIESDEIDILIDLAGHTAGARPEILARRPGRTQVSWLGFPGTTGSPSIDYLLADRVVAPAGAETSFSEALARLPHTFFPWDATAPVSARLPRRDEFGLPESGVVFACLHNPHKYEPTLFDAWLRIARAVEGSVLWLHGREPALQQALRARAEAHGLAGERLVFDRGALPKPEHLARLRLADLFLDTHFFNAHSTAAEALGAGLPVLTWPGNRFAGRVAASLLTAAGLRELIATDLDDYERTAVQLGNEPERRERLRERLLEARSTEPLFDRVRFTRSLEAAFFAMSERHEGGLPPLSFDLPPSP